jgi:hypothetical protein
MQTVILVHCRSRARGSLREAIASDHRLEDYDLSVQRRKKSGRNPGWAKLTSTQGDPGAVNLEWDGSTKTLTARVVTRGRQGPGLIIGLFIEYLLDRHSKRIRAISVFP